MSVPHIFANATSSIPLADLDENFNTPITIGITPVRLGDSVAALSGLTSVAAINGSFTSLDVSGTTIPAAKVLVVTTDIGVSVQPYSAGLASWASKTVPTGTVVGTSDTQTLTNKTVSVDNNTVSGIAASSFVLSNASGNIDGAAAQKAIPAGVVVGTTDTQTLTNKTISVDNNIITGLPTSSIVFTDASGNIDGGTNSKPIPAGAIVGTTELQILTNKTISAFDNIINGLPASSFVTTNAIGGLVTGGTKTIPSGVVVGTTDTQTLTNKTLTSPSLNSPTITTGVTSGKFTFGGAIDETVFTIVDGGTVALSPSNGTIQTWTLGASRVPTAGTWDAGESMTLMINDGTAYTINWTVIPVVWVGGVAPTLATTGFTVIELWKVGTTIYGALVGNVA